MFLEAGARLALGNGVDSPDPSLEYRNSVVENRSLGQKDSEVSLPPVGNVVSTASLYSFDATPSFQVESELMLFYLYLAMGASGVQAHHPAGSGRKTD